MKFRRWQIWGGLRVNRVIAENYSYVWLSDFLLQASIGILPEERLRRQPLVIDIKLYFPVSHLSPGETPVVDYAAVSVFITSIVSEKHYGLLEELGVLLLDRLFATYTVVSAIKLKLKKHLKQ